MIARILTAACCLALAAPAAAATPSLLVPTGKASVSSDYRQGMAYRNGEVLFAGAFEGVYRTTGSLREEARNAHVIPPDVKQREGYNHIGDVALDTLQGPGTGLLLPLECYEPLAPDTNGCHTGSIGVVDPQTLQWRYYVKLDSGQIQKAMWLAAEPARDVAWTQNGDALLAYRLSEITNAANAAPAGPALHAVERIDAALPPGSAISGAVVLGGRLYFANQDGDKLQIHSLDTLTGGRRLEFAQRIGTGEVEGMDAGGYASGILHVEVAHGVFGLVDVLGLAPRGSRIAASTSRRVRAGRPVRIVVHTSIAVNGYRTRLQGVHVTLAGKTAKTDATGKVVLRVELPRGRYTLRARVPGLRTGIAHIRAT